MTKAPLLEVKNLSIEFPTKRGTVKAVDGVSWTVDQGETLAILGESGSGKSVSSSAVMDLIDTPPAVISSGEILLRGVDLLQMPQAERQKVNGKTISMIFQDPLAALNPVYPIGWQIAETMRVHGIDQVTARRRVMELLARVGIADPERRARDYPHEFSGGQRQRIMIASAIALKPDLLIADEPTSALDVTVEAQVLDLLKEIQRESGMGLVIITHNLSVVERIADRVVVMQAGRIVESGPVAEVMSAPSHPYTQQAPRLRSRPPWVLRCRSGRRRPGRAPAARRACLEGLLRAAEAVQQDAAGTAAGGGRRELHPGARRDPRHRRRVRVGQIDARPHAARARHARPRGRSSSRARI